jgi:hypothetical protein
MSDRLIDRVQSVLLSSSFNLPTFSPNNILINFLPDPSHSQPNLPSPGRGGKLEVKVVVGEGAGHAVWKRIEGGRNRAEERRNQEEILRRSIQCDFFGRANQGQLYTLRNLIWQYQVNDALSPQK